MKNAEPEAFGKNGRYNNVAQPTYNLDYTCPIIFIMPQFNSYIDNLDLDCFNEYCRSHGTLHRYNRGECMIQQGTVGRYAALVVSGYLKYATLNSSGNEAVMGFALPGQIATDFHSSVHGRKAEMSIIAGISSDVIEISISEVPSLLTERFHREYRALYNTLYSRLVDLYRYSPKERYLNLAGQCPEIVKAVSLKDIASYLMITPNHLSRIRRELAFKHPE